MEKDYPMHNDDIITMLDLDRAGIKSIEVHHNGEEMIVDVVLNVAEHICPICNTSTSKIKGYSIKHINHSALNTTKCIIRYHARRYICPCCGKTFQENNPFAYNGSNISLVTVYNVLKDLKNPELTFTYVAKKHYISPSSVCNIFDKKINIPRGTLPECICFDEVYAFKGDKSNYCCVLLDYASGNIIDLLPSRRKNDLSSYFFNIPLKERETVRYVSYDMWQTYRIIGKIYFPNSVGILDKFHVLQEFTKRFSQARIRQMNYFKKEKDKLLEESKELRRINQKPSPDKQERLSNAIQYYYLYKKFSWVLLSNNKSINDPNQEKKFNRVLNRYCNLYDIFDLIRNSNNEMKEAIELKEILYDFYRKSTIDNAEAHLNEVIQAFKESSLKEIQSFHKTLSQWKIEIINSFIIMPSTKKKINNALIENRNKTIKTIKRTSNGYLNWERFRNRCLYCINSDEGLRL